MLERSLLVFGKIPRDARAGVEHQLHVQHRSVLGHDVQIIVIARILPGMRNPWRTDHALSSLVVAFLAADASSQRAREYLMPLFLPWMYMFGHRKAWRGRYVDAQELAVRLVGRLQKLQAYSERRVVDDVARVRHDITRRRTAPSWRGLRARGCGSA